MKYKREFRGFGVSLCCVLAFFGLAIFGEGAFGAFVTRVLLFFLVLIGVAFQLDAFQLINLDRLFWKTVRRAHQEGKE